mmetsp:Transcript_43926/g.74998  ORF Transcript_43926/g.74998 Transcript_43926/m.74998 type:complete len:102 (+) Transcript_43926:173-478(+)
MSTKIQPKYPFYYQRLQRLFSDSLVSQNHTNITATCSLHQAVENQHPLPSSIPSLRMQNMQCRRLIKGNRATIPVTIVVLVVYGGANIMQWLLFLLVLQFP